MYVGLLIDNAHLSPNVAGLDDSSRSMEATATKPAGNVDGREHHLSIPDHDGGNDACKTCAGTVWSQRWCVCV